LVDRLRDISELRAQGIERVVIDWNQFDPVVQLDYMVVIAVSLSKLLREREASAAI
jgi:hypothetical protein